MRKNATLLTATALGLVAAGALACRADTSGLVTLSTSEVEALLAAGEDVVACDANSARTRERYGVLPGAVLLSSYGDYDPAGELPAGRRLVFYCHSAMCSAAVDAARRAIAAGRTDVAVMPQGIREWVDEGRPVERPAAG